MGMNGISRDDCEIRFLIPCLGFDDNNSVVIISDLTVLGSEGLLIGHVLSSVNHGKSKRSDEGSNRV